MLQERVICGLNNVLYPQVQFIDNSNKKVQVQPLKKRFRYIAFLFTLLISDLFGHIVSINVFKSFSIQHYVNCVNCSNLQTKIDKAGYALRHGYIVIDMLLPRRRYGVLVYVLQRQRFHTELSVYES